MERKHIFQGSHPLALSGGVVQLGVNFPENQPPQMTAALPGYALTCCVAWKLQK